MPKNKNTFRNRFLFQPNKIIKRIYPKALWYIETEKPELFLTFDDGPVPELTEWVLDELKKYNARATFFCVGENIIKYPKIFERIKSEGHTVANHTYNHLKGFKHKTADYMQNVEKCERLTNTKLFRPPYGQLKKTQYKSLIREKYKVVMWDVISYDYEKISANECFANITKKAKSGSIILLHDNVKAEQNLKAVLPMLLKHYLDLNYSFMSIS